MNGAPPANSYPSPESILRELQDDAMSWDSSFPSVSAIRSILDQLEAAASPRTDSTIHADRHFGRFRLEQAIGQGGFGCVFLAIDTTLNRPVALKVPRPKYATSEVLRRAWLREAESAALLDHPHIVPVYEAGEIDELVYIASAYCPGMTLAQWLESQGGHIEPRAAARLLQQLADAVAHAHQRGLLHRDIKPANVLCQSDGLASGVIPRLTDFGLARSLMQTQTDLPDFQQAGTPRYMAPEQAAGNEREVGMETDIYGLGAVLFELLTGEAPFADVDVRETLRRIQHEPVPCAHLAEHRVPLDLQAICLKCLAKSPVDRYRSAGELRDDLARFLESRPVQARPLGRLRRLGRWCRRRPAIAGLVATVLLVSLMGIGGVVWHARQADRFAGEARQHELSAQEQAARAERHLADVQRALLDLSWMAQESSVWIDAPDHFQRAVRDQANRHYQQLIDAGIDSTDPGLRAAALSVQGLQASRDDENDLARQAFEASLALWRDAIAQFPDSRQYRRSLALTLFSYEQHLQHERRHAAPGSSDAGPEGFEMVLELAAVETHVHEEFAVLLYELGCNHLVNSNKPSAREMFSRAVVAWDGLLQKDPSNSDYRMRKAQSERHMGQLTSRVRQNRQIPQGYLESSLANLEQVVAQDPSNQSYRHHLAQTCLALGHFHRKDATKKALSYFERAIAILELLDAKAEPSVDYFLAEALAETANLCQQVGDFRKALNAREQCVEIWSRLEQDNSLEAVELEKFACVCHDYAELADLREQTEVARIHYARADQLFEKLDQQNQLSSLTRVAWAQCMVFAGDELLRSGDPAAAEVPYRRAMDQLNRVVARQPHNEPILRRQRELQARLDEVAAAVQADSGSTAGARLSP